MFITFWNSIASFFCSLWASFLSVIRLSPSHPTSDYHDTEANLATREEELMIEAEPPKPCLSSLNVANSYTSVRLGESNALKCVRVFVPADTLPATYRRSIRPMLILPDDIDGKYTRHVSRTNRRTIGDLLDQFPTPPVHLPPSSGTGDYPLPSVKVPYNQGAYLPSPEINFPPAVYQCSEDVPAVQPALSISPFYALKHAARSQTSMRHETYTLPVEVSRGLAARVMNRSPSILGTQFSSASQSELTAVSSSTTAEKDGLESSGSSPPSTSNSEVDDPVDAEAGLRPSRRNSASSAELEDELSSLGLVAVKPELLVSLAKPVLPLRIVKKNPPQPRQVGVCSVAEPDSTAAIFSEPTLALGSESSVVSEPLVSESVMESQTSTTLSFPDRDSRIGNNWEAAMKAVLQSFKGVEADDEDFRDLFYSNDTFASQSSMVNETTDDCSDSEQNIESDTKILFELSMTSTLPSEYSPPLKASQEDSFETAIERSLDDILDMSDDRSAPVIAVKLTEEDQADLPILSVDPSAQGVSTFDNKAEKGPFEYPFLADEFPPRNASYEDSYSWMAVTDDEDSILPDQGAWSQLLESLDYSIESQ